ncbi:cobalamin B12-binding domain-containing protein [Piscinibacter sakaiensis]|uniref:cobalamin B12-binding domain-containing protein n=1 Tax=Piscinibacter sakaiensis TaxID=1547922 RepID=UPI0006B50824|nr:cobalamin B12-binding domain-containing protein [Piscinibacter sakaiensis]
MLSWPFPLPPRLLPAWWSRVRGRLLSSAFGGTADGHAGPPPSARADPGEECRSAMRSVLETHIIPRLLHVTRPHVDAHARPAGAAPLHADVETYAHRCAAGDHAGCLRLIARLRAAGLQPEQVLVDLVAPAARHLGRLWETDQLDFSAVTLGLVLMHETVHALGYANHEGPQESGAVLRVMLASAPGSQHVLGLSIVSEFFRKAGWQVVLEVSPTSAELCRAAANEWFDLIGLSVALDAQLAELPSLVARLRAASRNPQLPVLLGGPAFIGRDLPAERFGAQGVCVDAREALGVAVGLVGR